jgi:hypothetical protein
MAFASSAARSLNYSPIRASSRPAQTPVVPRAARRDGAGVEKKPLNRRHRRNIRVTQGNGPCVHPG